MARRCAGALLDLVLPADCLLCGRPLPWRQRGGVCLPCWAAVPWTPGLGLRPAGALRAVLWAAEYDGPVRRLIHGLKFDSMDYLGRPLGEAAAARLAPLLDLARADLVLPVPLHWWRRFRRGYNQARLLAAPIARGAGLPLATAILSRRRAGRRQLGLTRPERLRALRGCFAARRSRLAGLIRPALQGKDVLLVDDVMTTGATLEACAKALLRGGAASVTGCVLARTPRRD